MSQTVPTTAVGDLISRATALAASGDPAATRALVDAAGGDRGLLEAARDHLAGHLHSHPDDFDATGALTLVNRAISSLPRRDPLDWRVRWSQHRKP